tara:strand:- start:7953 stop:8099 length:147 start_codon:yes stop_codon:yes gene_type:complete
MATRKAIGLPTKIETSRHMRTSIGRSSNSRPKNKNIKRDWKKYRGQGK